MSDWIAIPETLLAEAGESLAPPNPTDAETDVPRALLEAIVDYLSEDLGCDHSVGICMCGIIDVVGDLKLALDGRRRCPANCEEGAVFSMDRFDESVKEYMERHSVSENEARRDLCDFDGMVNCSVCDGSGSVPVGKLEASNG